MGRSPEAAPEIRPLAPGDSLEELTRLLHTAYAELGAMGLNFTAVDQPVEVTRKRLKEGVCFVAVSDGAIVGTIAAQPPIDDPACPYFGRPHVASAHQLAVLPAYRRRGIASCLLARAETWARSNGYSELVLDTAEPARHLVALYGRLGYEHVGNVQWAGKRYRSVLMSKKL